MNDTPSGEQKKKIIIDEDWKGQVEAEREQLKRQSEKPAESQESEAKPPPAAGPLPPPSLEFVVSSFAMQAMVSLGMMANPLTNETEVQLEQAKHFIDTIEMLQEKTEGNRTPEENTMMHTILHELRMTYISVQQQGAPPAS